LKTGAFSLLALCVVAPPALAQPYEISWWTTDGGGVSNAAGGAFVVDATIGQPDAGGPFAGTPYVLHSGFWSLLGTGGAVAQADLSLSLSDAPDPVAPGGSLAYTIQVTNQGPAASPGMTVIDTLPAQVTFVSSTPGAPTCSHSAGTLTCALGSLAPSAGATVTVNVSVSPSATGTLSNAAVVSGGAPDPFAANNSDVETTQLVAAAAEGELAHGTRLRAGLAGVGSSADVDLYRMRQQPYASYEVALDAASGDVGVGAGPHLERLAPDGSTVLQAAQAIGTGPARSLRFLNNTAVPIDGQLVRVRSASCGSGCGADDVYRLRAWESTLSIPRFNNSASQLTVVTLQNRTVAPVAGQIRFWSAAGVLLHTEPLSLAARGSVSLNTSVIPALAGQGGSITVAHDGGYGALAGKSVALEPATGYAFDSFAESRPR
jgi:uncharacterized repeat protein (TIGR01451 family)